MFTAKKTGERGQTGEDRAPSYEQAFLLVPATCRTDQSRHPAAYQHQAAGATGRDVQHSAPK